MFRTQKIVNKFPKNSTVREDPSSFGFKLFSVVGDISAQLSKDLIRSNYDYNLFTSNTDYITSLYEWDVSSHEFNINSHNSYIADINVIGDSVTLNEIKDVDNFLSVIPTRVNLIGSLLAEHTIYNENINTSGTILDIDFPNYLYLEFENCENFISSQNIEKISPTLYGYINLSGEDIYGNELAERISILTNGTYRTTNIYNKLFTITVGNISGESGTLKIKIFDVDISYMTSKYQIFVDSEDNQKEIKYSFDSSNLLLNYFIFSDYNNLRPDYSLQEFTGFTILDSDNNNYSITDITFSENYENLFVLSNDKILIIDSVEIPIMEAPVNKRTTEIAIDCEFLSFFPKKNSYNKLYLYLKRIDLNIEEATIKLIDPSSTIWYLNYDLEWQETPCTWIADKTYANSNLLFKDIRPEVLCDLLGQWELVIDVITTEDETFTTVKNFYVPYLTASEIISLDTEYDWISYHPNGNLYLGNTSDNSIDIYSKKYDYYYFDSTNKRIYTIENYNELEVLNE